MNQTPTTRLHISTRLVVVKYQLLQILVCIALPVDTTFHRISVLPPPISQSPALVSTESASTYTMTKRPDPHSR